MFSQFLLWQDTEKSKILQSIASVIQALPPEEEIPPVLAIVCPVVEKLEQALRSSSRVRAHEALYILVVQCSWLFISYPKKRELWQLFNFKHYPEYRRGLPALQTRCLSSMKPLQSERKRNVYCGPVTIIEWSNSERVCLKQLEVRLSYGRQMRACRT